MLSEFETFIVYLIMTWSILGMIYCIGRAIEIYYELKNMPKMHFIGSFTAGMINPLTFEG